MSAFVTPRVCGEVELAGSPLEPLNDRIPPENSRLGLASAMSVVAGAEELVVGAYGSVADAKRRGGNRVVVL